MCPFHMFSCLLLGLNSLGRRGRHFGLLPRQLWDFPLTAREGFLLPDLVPPAVCFSRQLPTLSLPPARLNSTGEFKFPSLLDTAGPRRAVLLVAKSSLTTEASLPREHYHHPQPTVGKLRHKEIKNVLMITRGGCATDGNQTHSPRVPSPKTVLPLHYTDINICMHIYIHHSTLKMHFHSSGTTV